MTAAATPSIPSTGRLPMTVTTVTDDMPGLNEPVPYTLTPKAVARLDQEDRYAAEIAELDGNGEVSAPVDDGPGEYEWECIWCGSVFFGTPLLGTAPDDQTCDACRDEPCNDCQG